MSNAILDQLDKDEIVEAVRKGVCDAIWKLLRNKLENRPHRQVRVFTAEDCEIIKQDYAAGVPVAETAAKLNSSYYVVKRKARQLGVKWQRQRKEKVAAPKSGRCLRSYTPEDLEVIKQDYAAGVPVREMAEKLG